MALHARRSFFLAFFAEDEAAHVAGRLSALVLNLTGRKVYTPATGSAAAALEGAVNRMLPSAAARRLTNLGAGVQKFIQPPMVRAIAAAAAAAAYCVSATANASSVDARLTTPPLS